MWIPHGNRGLNKVNCAREKVNEKKKRESERDDKENQE